MQENQWQERLIQGKSRIIALTRKELYSYLNAPAFYGAAVFFLAFSSVWLFYIQRYFTLNVATLRPYFISFPIVFILVIPVLTMKSWAEERKTGSIELLLTMPFSEWELVLGKFFSAFALLAMMLVLTIPLPLCLAPLGEFDKGVIVCEYIGAFLMGASAVALGLLLSSLSKNQAGSFLGSAVAMMAVMLINNLTFSMNLPFWLSEFINFISLSFHFESFSKGLLDSRDVIYFLTSSGLFLFITTRVVLFRRWN
ncbi:MAG: ABC transporter permease subunit [Treponema sp.]|jgi:ABC-2 type transport system permease protein|nr:ABC transporter permease subunit [Treponema sp.]